MSRPWFVAIAGALLLVACSGPQGSVLGEIEIANLAANASTRFVANLSGAQEVPPATTRARGVATFALDASGDALTYRLIVANIENVTMAHIHLAPVGVNGPVVVWLYPDGPPPELIPGRTQGVLAEGFITAADLVGPLAGGTLDDLIEELADGNAYVNVHTSQFPGGEVRGQIR